MIRLQHKVDEVNQVKLNERQNKIISIISKNDGLSSDEIHTLVGKEFYSRPTVNRDLALLLHNNILKQIGLGRTTKYALNQSILLKQFDVDEYFKLDFRSDIINHFNMDIFKEINTLFTKDELVQIDQLNQVYKHKMMGQTNTGIKKELERLTIEFSWKSSSIEGNTYTLLDTERLIKEKVKAEGHSEEEATMILNHKYALSYILENPSYFQELSVYKLEELHHLISKELSITFGIRRSMVGITGTNYRPLDNEFSIREALEKLFFYLNSETNPVEKALIAVAMISYIQPFEDGNKRTARMLGNAILIANNLIPVSFVGVNNIEYKKAIILFYEQNSIVYLKQLFLEQYALATNKYF